MENNIQINNEVIGKILCYEMEQNETFERLNNAINKYPRKKVFHIIENENNEFFTGFDVFNIITSKDYKEALCFTNFEEALVICNLVDGRIRKVRYSAKEKWHLSNWGINYPFPNQEKIKYLIKEVTNGDGQKNYEIVQPLKYNINMFTVEVENEEEVDDLLIKMRKENNNSRGK